MTFNPTEEYFDLLNEAVASELQVSIQYFLQHAKMEKILRHVRPENMILDKTTYDVIGEKLKEISIQEMKHAGDLMERIYYLGGQATTKSGKPTIGDTLSEFAQIDANEEKKAMELYRKIIDKAIELGDWKTRDMFERIYSEEEEHYFTFEEYLDLDDSEPEGPEPFETEWRKIITDDYLDLLNQAVGREISAIIQYVNQHEKAHYLALRKKDTPLQTVVDTNKAEVVGEILEKTAMKEMEHLEMIAERIYLLEGESVYNPNPLPQVGEGPDDFLKLAHKAEDETIVLYRKIIKEAMERGDTTTRRIFEEILQDEEEHYWEFDDWF